MCSYEADGYSGLCVPLVMMHFSVMMRLPRPHRSADTDCVHLGTHCVLYVRGNKQKAPNRVGHCPSLIERRSHRDFQRAGYYSDSCVLIVGVMLPMTGRNEKCISERLPRCVFVPFQHRPLVSVRIDALPDDIAGVPCFNHGRLPRGQQSKECNQDCADSLQVLLLRNVCPSQA